MKTSEFLEALTNGGDFALVFEPYAGVNVPAGYHITEVMNVHVDSVDCGGRMSQFSRTVVQLINGTPTNDGGFMTAAKAAKIFERVNQKNPLLTNEEIFFEWGDKDYRTSTYAVEEIVVEGGSIFVRMHVPATQCKPAVEAALQRGAGNGVASLVTCC